MSFKQLEKYSYDEEISDDDQQKDKKEKRQKKKRIKRAPLVLSENGGSAKQLIKKKKVSKKEENQGLRIIEERKIKSLFMKICNPDGQITLESLGRSMAKYKIEFQIQDLKDMLNLCQNQVKQVEEECSVSQRNDEQAEKQWRIKLEEFKSFYGNIYKK